MSYTNVFTVPTYYKDFLCKGHECRHSCCCGWNVSISMKEYFNLLSFNCSKKMRRILDKTFYIVNNPTQDYYAMIAKDMNNDCSLHMENGFCMLQYEYGENILPAICRYYP